MQGGLTGRYRSACLLASERLLWLSVVVGAGCRWPGKFLKSLRIEVLRF